MAMVNKKPAFMILKQHRPYGRFREGAASQQTGARRIEARMMDDPTTEQVRLFLAAGQSRSALTVAIMSRLPLRYIVAALLATIGVANVAEPIGTALTHKAAKAELRTSSADQAAKLTKN